ncbi:MAG: IS30 family transposase [Minisyncoccota bacterium]
MYQHISKEQRAVIAALRRHGESDSEIARVLGVHRATIGRELRRNAQTDGSYHASHADVLARERRKRSKLAYRSIENDAALAERIERRMHPLVSPEVIAHDESVTHQTIYAWVYRSRHDLLPLLPHRGRRRRRYGSKRASKQGWTQHVHPIDERPISADKRLRVGHFEGDTVRGRNGDLLTLTDRKSRFEVAVKVPGEWCDSVHAAIAERKEMLDARSFTFDRGSCFSLWQMIEKDTGAPVFFAHPRAPWERGTNENSNGRLRRVFRKRCDFGTVTQRDVDATVSLMNHTKRKCLNWRTPCEVFGKCCTSD